MAHKFIQVRRLVLELGVAETYTELLKVFVTEVTLSIQMPTLPPLSNSSESSAGRYSPSRHKPPYLVSNVYLQTSAPPYLSRTHEGPAPIGASIRSESSSLNTTYAPHRTNVPSVHSHMVPLMPSGYPTRSTVGGGYGLMPNQAARPLVMPVHPPPLGPPLQTMRHYPPPHPGSYISGSLSSQAPGATLATRSSPAPVPRSQDVPAAVRHTTATPVSRGSNHHGSSIHSRSALVAPSSVPVASHVAPSVEPHENLDAPALTFLPFVPPVQDANADIMIEGLKLQHQKWPEKNEVRKLFSDLTSLAEMLRALAVAQSGDTRVAWDICQAIRTVIQEHLPSNLRRLRERITCMAQAQKATEQDIQLHSSRLTERLNAIAFLRNEELVSARRVLAEARRRRQYQEEFEALAGEILTRKHRDVYQKELEKEKTKLQKAEESFKRCQRVAQLRKTQADGVLLHIRDMLQSLKDPSSLVTFLDAPPPDEQMTQNISCPEPESSFA